MNPELHKEESCMTAADSLALHIGYACSHGCRPEGLAAGTVRYSFYYWSGFEYA